MGKLFEKLKDAAKASAKGAGNLAKKYSDYQKEAKKSREKAASENLKNLKTRATTLKQEVKVAKYEAELAKYKKKDDLPELDFGLGSGSSPKKKGKSPPAFNGW